METPRTVDQVFDDYSARRSGLLKALTSDVDEFYTQCDPDKENLCLYGNPDATWSVDLPAEEVPPELPEPALGINFARDGMQRKDWLALVAVHSDAWLLAVAFYYGAKFNKSEREQLFKLINQLATVYETITGKKQSKANAVKPKKRDTADAYEADQEAGDPCPLCDVMYRPGEFWIGCDVCELWYHGKCVKMTPAKADGLKHYKCPDCAKKR
mmetsp:Transcript_48866/g.156519  ORF Transcript_48866/g.156519 Transcript_48866/m.156519 type:complete len:213 (+) Transcript_48866:228-866(+)|eukprot:CAMPEP_0182897086 /NCGR_PEP_ID=MMETSP0034_2-20130328/26674_1 /TAXON_ID=156128 /ORGANISM="Nephroselmis pyriformis, Strain CCMP717" /LENGTH=212 /DNA_ID=CAMNT_0025030981 /DNA_START=198 /DNA_END=836 /DNA_ORIENTATION=-